MKKASLVIKEIQEGSYNDILKVVYIDENRIEKQPQRYVAAIEKFISLYGDQMKLKSIVHQEEVK